MLNIQICVVSSDETEVLNVRENLSQKQHFRVATSVLAK